MLGSVPVLIDFEQSILTSERVAATDGESYKTRHEGVLAKVAHFVLSSVQAPTEKNATRFVAEVKLLAAKPRILVIGGGVVGHRAHALYDDPGVCVIGSDVYKSALTHVVADGHLLPIETGSLQGVWIQAVLEHVLDPNKVVSEIHRVLAPNGIVYAETPFMQQVHEGPYDFTRFTPSGHRWLFRQFEGIDNGVTSGPGTVLLWSIRYLAGAIFRSYRIGTLAALAFFWVRYLDLIVSKSYSIDGPSGVYFLGRASSRSMTHSEILIFYAGPQ
jgi:SAM-dependent methyltransferase